MVTMHQTFHLKWVHFIVCGLCLNQLELRGENIFMLLG